MNDQNKRDAYNIALWLRKRSSDEKSDISDLTLRLMTNLGPEKASKLIMNSVRAVNASSSAESPGPKFLDGGLGASSMTQKLINSYHAQLQRTVVQPLLYDFMEKLFAEEPQAICFAAMTPEHTDMAIRILGIPAIKEPDKEEIKAQICELKAKRAEIDKVVYGFGKKRCREIQEPVAPKARPKKAKVLYNESSSEEGFSDECDSIVGDSVNEEEEEEDREFIDDD